MPKFRFVKMSKDWAVTGPLSEKAFQDRLAHRTINGVGVSGKPVEAFTIDLGDKAMIVFVAKADGADIGLVEF